MLWQAILHCVFLSISMFFFSFFSFGWFATTIYNKYSVDIAHLRLLYIVVGRLVLLLLLKKGKMMLVNCQHGNITHYCIEIGQAFFCFWPHCYQATCNTIELSNLDKPNTRKKHKTKNFTFAFPVRGLSALKISFQTIEIVFFRKSTRSVENIR